MVPRPLLMLLLEDDETLLDELEVPPPVPVPVLELDDETEELLEEPGGTTTGPVLELDEAALLDEDLLEDDELVGVLEALEEDTLEAEEDEDALLDDEELPGTLEDAADEDTLEADDEDLLEDDELLGTLDDAAEDETLEADEEDLLDDEELLGALDEAADDELDELDALRSAQKPTEVLLLFAAIALFHDIGVTETVLPLWAQVAFQSWFTLPLGRLKLPFQSLTAVVPVLVTVTWPQKPVPQSLLTV